MTNSELFELFLREKQYIDRVSNNTLRSYRDAYRAFERYHGELTPQGLKTFVVNLVTAQLSPRTVNSWASGINSFLTWLHANDHVSARLRVPLQRTPKTVLQTYPPEDVQRIINHKPRSFTGKRLMAILFLLVDTGARVSESLSLSRTAVDLDNLLITLEGKGNKQRIVPISLECRKALFRWLQTHNHDLVFCTRDGYRLSYHNIRRDFLVILRAAGVDKSVGTFHTFRRYFAKSYLRSGGSALYLQRVLGHTSLTMTNRYVEADTEDLQLAHKALSPLESLRSKR